MEINEPLKSEQSILLNARKAVVVIFVIFAIYIFFSSFLLGYGKEIYFGKDKGKKTRGRFVCHILISGEDRINRCSYLTYRKIGCIPFFVKICFPE